MNVCHLLNEPISGAGPIGRCLHCLLDNAALEAELILFKEIKKSVICLIWDVIINLAYMTEELSFPWELNPFQKAMAISQWSGELFGPWIQVRFLIGWEPFLHAKIVYNISDQAEHTISDFILFYHWWELSVW